MTRFVLRRLLAMVGVLFAVSVLTFLIFNVMPSTDPAVRMAGKNPNPGEVAAIRHTWGFDKPLPEQYVVTMKKVFSGNLVSYASRDDVTAQIKAGIPRTVFLAVGAGVLMLLGGIVLGAVSALKADTWLDRVTSAGSVVWMSMPSFWVAALVSYYLGSKAGIIPPGGYETIAEGGVLGWLWHLIAPCAVLALLYVGIYSRILRSDLIGALGADYVRTARAKGLAQKDVVRRHALRNALIPFITLWGLDVGIFLGGGAVLIEKVFDLGGVGQYFADSIDALDVPPVLAITMFSAVTIVVVNALVDILYAALDPRIRR